MATSSSMILAIAIAFLILPFCTVGLRLWSRGAYKLGYGADDWVILAAFVTYIIGYSVPVMILTTQHHLGDPSPVDASGKVIPPTYAYEFWSFWTEVWSPLPIGLTKISVTLFYRRIFRGTAFNIINWTAFALSIGWLTHIFATIFRCVHPIAITPVRGQQCVNSISLFIAVAALDFVIDVLILATPIPFIWKLHMKPSHKLAVSGVFMIGLLTAAACLTRLIFFVQAGKAIQAGAKDQPYEAAPTVYWSLLEASIGIIAASLITLKPIFRDWSPENLIRSVRSVLSLQSHSSAKTKQNGEMTKTVAQDHSRSDSVPLHPYIGDNHTSVDVGPRPVIEDSLQDRIVVETSWSSESRQVPV